MDETKAVVKEVLEKVWDTTFDKEVGMRWKLLQYDPYVMVYDKPNAPKQIRDLQRWVNNRFIFRSCDRFEDYK